jgi:hypothetical protein
MSVSNDREQLVDLVHLYSDAVTRYDATQWTNTWAVDATWDLGKGRAFAGRDEIVAYWHSAMAGLRLVVQMAHNGTVTMTGADTANGRWYVSEHLERSTGERGILLAWYDDTYVRIENQWKFSRRALTRLYGGAADLSAGFMLPPDSGWPSP